MTLDPLCTRERVVIPPRATLTPAQKRAIWSREHGVCWWCVRQGRYGAEILVALEMAEFDHCIPRELNGSDAHAGIFPLHFVCHRAKTKLDRKQIAKAHAQEKLTRPKEPSKRPIKGRSGWPQGKRSIPQRADPWGYRGRG